MASRGLTIDLNPFAPPADAPGGGRRTDANTQADVMQFEKKGSRSPSRNTAPGGGKGSGNEIAVVMPVPAAPVAPMAAAYSARSGLTPATPIPPMTRPPR